MYKNRYLNWYIVCFMCFGVVSAVANIGYAEELVELYNISDTYKNIIIITTCLCLIDYIIVGIIISWVVNLTYILTYKKIGYSIDIYNFFPFIYIKKNKKKIKLSFNILSLLDIVSSVEYVSNIKSKMSLEKYIKDMKAVYYKIRCIYYLMGFASILLIFINIKMGVLLLIYVFAIFIFQLNNEANVFGYGYIYLSKSNVKYEFIYSMVNTMKISINDKEYIHRYFQEKILKEELAGTIVNEILHTIMIDSINDNVEYLNELIEDKIYSELTQQAYFNEYSFLNNYRLYRMYCLYTFKFHGKDTYDLLIGMFRKFWGKRKEMFIIKNIRMFENDRVALESSNFKRLNLKSMFDICNMDDRYIWKLDKVIKI